MTSSINFALLPVAAFLVALLVSVWVIPLMIGLAPRLGMVDKPDPRKVHRLPIARVGGMGIALGAIFAVLLLAPHETLTRPYVVGALILVFFGAWDDARELGHYPKFLGQIAAAAIVIWYGGVVIYQLPFLSDPLPAWIAKPFTLIAIVGVINAINHSDGLDGLAGGETLLSLGAMACLATLAENQTFLILAAAIGGGLLGFVRFNTFPARVFMGDLGSQFLGFSAAVLAIWLTQQVNPSLSKSSALLLVGLPVVDILAVLYQRMRAKMNWFRATRNHVHHRLLDLGFDHYQAVLVIYAIQAVLNLSAVFLGFESDVLLLTLYFTVCGGLFVCLYIAEARKFRINRDGRSSVARFFTRPKAKSSLLVSGPLLFVQISVPSYLVITSIAIGSASPLPPVPIYVVGLIGLLGVFTLVRTLQKSVLYRLALYSSIGVIAYCIYSAAPLLPSMHTVANLAYFLILAVALSLAASHRRGDDFAVTNMDFLIILGLLAAEMFSLSIVGSSIFWTVAIGTVLVFYACELIIARSGVMWNRILGAATAGALGIIVARVFL